MILNFIHTLFIHAQETLKHTCGLITLPKVTYKDTLFQYNQF